MYRLNGVSNHWHHPFYHQLKPYKSCLFEVNQKQQDMMMSRLSLKMFPSAHSTTTLVKINNKKQLLHLFRLVDVLKQNLNCCGIFVTHHILL